MTTGPSRGFTLVEVMVAISVVALIMLTTVAGFRTLGNTASTISLMTDRSNEMRSVSTFLRDAFENSVSYMVRSTLLDRFAGESFAEIQVIFQKT